LFTGTGKARGLVSVELGLFIASLTLTGSQQHSNAVTHNCSVLRSWWNWSGCFQTVRA